jgi:small ligand-binding sensory domain FIST
MAGAAQEGKMAGAKAAVARGAGWEAALGEALAATGQERVDLALLFVSPHYGRDLPALVEKAYRDSGAAVLVGCSGGGVIGAAEEVEGEPAVALMTLELPGADLHGVHLRQADLEKCAASADWLSATGVTVDGCNGWLLFADPFRMDVQRLVDGLAETYREQPLIGGLASGDPQAPRTQVFLNDQVYAEGAVALALGGAYGLRTIVSQGAEPISKAWTITQADGNFVRTIGQRPALEVLVEALKELPSEEQARAQRNLLIGLAMDEYRHEFGRGDFLIRNLAGVDRASGAIAVGAQPRVGQTIQFQLRDARAADEELQTLLRAEQERPDAPPPLAAVLCTCNARGAGLFGAPNHDAAAIARELGLAAIAGFFCNGEIGPVGRGTFLHGYTASIALIVPRA